MNRNKYIKIMYEGLYLGDIKSPIGVIVEGTIVDEPQAKSIDDFRVWLDGPGQDGKMTQIDISADLSFDAIQSIKDYMWNEYLNGDIL